MIMVNRSAQLLRVAESADGRFRIRRLACVIETFRRCCSRALFPVFSDTTPGSNRLKP